MVWEREFFFNSVIEDDDGEPTIINIDYNIKNEFNKVFDTIKRLSPFFKNITLKRKISKIEGNFNVTYEQFEYIDFNGEKITMNVEKNREFIVKQYPYRY